MENLNTILYLLAGALTLAEVVLRWVLRGFWKDPKNAGTVETVHSFWVAMILALGVKAVALQPFTIPSGSMEDTLLIGDYLLVKKYEYGYTLFNRTGRFLQFKDPQRGEILVFVYPKDPSKDYIKRCVGLPGDVLSMRDKVLTVNRERQEEPYVKHIDPQVIPASDYFSGWRDNWGPVTVMQGHYFMMGDNRDNSADSRKWGQLDGRLIKGRAWVTYYHSMGIPAFLVLAGLVVALFCLPSVLLSAWRLRGQGLKPDEAAQEKAGLRGSLMTLVGALVVSGVLWAAVGADSFQGKWQKLKERSFKTIR